MEKIGKSGEKWQNIFTKWPAAAILDDLKITFDRISRHFRSMRNFLFFYKMAAGGHFG